MKYIELNEEEKSELRSTLWSESIDNDEWSNYAHLSAEEQAVVDNCSSPAEIPEAVMIAAYGIYDFVPQDFFCNL